MSYRSFEEVWQDIKKLKGEDVYTLRRHHRNLIVKVDEKGMIRHAEGSKKDAPISKATFERAWKKLIKDREFVPVENGGYYFACACIACLPEVEFSCKPVCLYLRQQNTHPLGKPKEYTE